MLGIGEGERCAASDIPAVWKGNADYGAMTLDDGGVIHLCSSACEIATAVGADDSLGLILLIDNRRTAPDDDLLRHLRSFDAFIRRTAVAVGITHMDQQPRPRIDLFHTVNLKCDPERAIELRERYEGIVPGYHMNKQHWNTVDVTGTVPLRLLLELVDHSYDLVRASLPKKVRDALH